jgi:hypothetical protein
VIKKPRGLGGHSPRWAAEPEIIIIIIIIIIKQSHYMPGEAHRVPGGISVQISIQSAHEGDKVVSPKKMPRRNSWYSLYAT